MSMSMFEVTRRPHAYNVAGGFVHDRGIESGNRVEHELPRHEKIRFRRDEIADLATLPSAAGLRSRADPAEATGAQARRRGIAAWRSLAALIRCLVLAVLRVSMRSASSASARKGCASRPRRPSRRSPAWTSTPRSDRRASPSTASRFLALEVRDVSLKRAADGAELIDAGLRPLRGALPAAAVRQCPAVQRRALRRAHHRGGVCPTRTARTGRRRCATRKA